MKNNKMIKENIENRNIFLITGIFSIFLLIILCYFGMKGTHSADAYVCSNSSWVIVSGTSSCCPKGWNYDDGYCVDGTFNNKIITDDYCLNNEYLVKSNSGNYCSKSGWEIYNQYNCVNYDTDSCRVTAGTLIESSEAVSYKVTYNAMGGTVSPSSDTCIASNAEGCSIGSLAIPERKGFDFGGWVIGSSANCSTGQYFTNDTKINKDTTIYACWNDEEPSCNYKVLPNNLIEGFKYSATLITLPISQEFNNESYDCRTTLLLNKDVDFYNNEMAVQNYLNQICDYANEDPTLGSILARGWYCYLKKTTSLTSGNGTMKEYYTLTYDANGGLIKSTDLNKTESTWNSLYIPGQNIELIGGEYQQLGIYVSRNGYVFKGWAEKKSDCSSSKYLNKNIVITNDKTVYACWENSTLSLTLDANGGYFISVSDGSQEESITKNAVYNSSKNVYEVTLKYTEYNLLHDDLLTFKGWAKSYASCSSGNDLIKDGGTIEVSNNSTVLYACWGSGVQEYTVSFNANGGSGAPSNQTKKHGVTLTLSTEKPTKTNNTFNGWNTKKDGSGTSYEPGSKYDKNENVTLYAQWTANSSGGTTTETKKCVYEKGQYVWKNASSGENVVASLTTESACLAKNTPVCIKKDGVNEWGIPAPNDQILSNLDTEAKCFGIVYTKYYTVKYNLDGGKFPNGETSRTVIVSSNENLISPKINPVKKDYKFIGWYNGNTKFTGFDSKITKDYELTARYEKLEDNKCTYTCNGSDVYDPSIKECISINVNNKPFGIVTNTIKIELGCNNSAAINKELISSNEEYICANGYEKEYWLAYDTCKLNGECINTGSICERRFEATCYKTYNATEKCSNSGTGGNVNDNPQTGNIVIALIWLFGLAAIGYSIYYFKELQKN